MDVRNIVLFVGSGASVQFGKPTTSGFREFLKSKYVDYDPADKKAVLMLSLVEGDQFEDAEEMLQCLKELVSLRSDKSYLGKYIARPESNATRTIRSHDFHISSLVDVAKEAFETFQHDIFEKYR